MSLFYVKRSSEISLTKSEKIGLAAKHRVGFMVLLQKQQQNCLYPYKTEAKEHLKNIREGILKTCFYMDSYLNNNVIIMLSLVFYCHVLGSDNNNFLLSTAFISRTMTRSTVVFNVSENRRCTKIGNFLR